MAGERYIEDLVIPASGSLTVNGSVSGISAGIDTDPLWAAKGDIVAATADNAAAVVTVGTDGTSLVANSGAASGVSYADRIRGSVGATDNRLVRSDGTGTQTVQSTGITVDDSQNVSGMGTLGCGAITSSGAISGTTGTFSGDATVGTAAGASTRSFDMLAASGQVKQFRFYAGTDRRWTISSGSTDSFGIARYTGGSTGTFQDFPLIIANSDGQMTLAKTVLFTGIRAVTATGAASAPELGHGSYTPTLTGVANVASSTSAVFWGHRVGNTVSFKGYFSVTPSSGGANTLIGVSLAVASNFALSSDARGIAKCYAPSTVHDIQMYGDSTNDRIEVQFTSSGTGAHGIYLDYTYTVI